MKFLLFNVAVAAALVFLFTADRGEVQKIAGQVHDAAGDMKAYANKALNRDQTRVDRDAVSSARQTEPVSDAESAQPAPPAATVQPEPTPEPPLSPQLARNLPAMPEIGSETGSKSDNSAPADLDPAVAKRRREVLDGIETADAAPALKEGTRLMTPSERRRELLSLAEEMELLYARSISQ